MILTNGCYQIFAQTVQAIRTFEQSGDTADDKQRHPQWPFSLLQPELRTAMATYEGDLIRTVNIRSK